MTTAESRTRRMLGAHLARNRLTNAKGSHHIAYVVEPAGTVALPERERVPIDR